MLHGPDVLCWGGPPLLDAAQGEACTAAWDALTHGRIGMHLPIGPPECRLGARPLFQGVTVRSLAMGGMQICALTDDARVRCYDRDRGEIPVATHAVDLDMDGATGCWLSEDDDVTCWGVASENFDVPSGPPGGRIARIVDERLVRCATAECDP
jgi:hypothetical protein